MIQLLNVVKDACNFRSTKYNTFWHLRLQLGIQLTDVALNLRVDHYLGWTFALFHLILLLGGYYTISCNTKRILWFEVEGREEKRKPFFFN